MRKVYNASILNDFFPFAAVTVVYMPRDIRAEALQVTRENIGAIALELDLEVFYPQPEHAYVVVPVGRADGKGAVQCVMKSFKLTDWMVGLRGELHQFEDDVFWSTFSPLGDPSHAMNEEPIGTITKSEMTDDGLKIEGKLTPASIDSIPGFPQIH